MQSLIIVFIDEMRAEGYAVESILRVLRQHGVSIAARTCRAWKNPAQIPDRTVTDGKCADGLLNRDVTAPAPNLVWVTDLTDVRTWAGFVVVAFTLDVFAQRIVIGTHRVARRSIW